jgi:Domain of unknown function (DUF4375)
MSAQEFRNGHSNSLAWPITMDCVEDSVETRHPPFQSEDAYGVRADKRGFGLMGVDMDFNDVLSAIAILDDDAVEQFLFDCLERRFGREKLQASDYTFNLTLPVGYRMLTPTVWIEAEVTNGGAGQYFWNRFVDYRPMTADAIDGYEKIGAKAQAEAVRDCLRVFASLEADCQRLMDDLGAYEGFDEWQVLWDALKFKGDIPLSDYEMVTKRFRVPWIRNNPGLFVFPVNPG